MFKEKIEPTCYNFCPKPGDYIVFKYNHSSYDFDMEELQYFFNAMKEKFCNNEILLLPINIDVESCDKNEIIPFLENYIEQIKEIENDNLH